MAEFYTVEFGGVGPLVRGQTVRAAALGENVDLARLTRIGAIREATPEEITVAEQEEQFAAGNADALRLPDDPQDLIVPAPFTSGAPVGFPGPRDDQEARIAESTKQAEQEALTAADADAADAPRKRSR